MQKLTPAEKKNYLEQVVIPGFLPLVDKPLYSFICDDEYKLVICTNMNAHSLDYGNWQEMIGLSYKDPSEDLIKKIFKDKYDSSYREEIDKYIQTILEAQEFVLNTGQVSSMFDLLPYNGTFKSYLVLYTPIFHPNGEVIALQSFSHESKFFGFKEHFLQLTEHTVDKSYSLKSNLTKREEEVIFLLANGLTQEQISKTLNLSRSTIANLIANQLSEKFNISGANTHLLTQIAVESGLFQQIPESLYRPFVVSLRPDEVLDINED
ncbi:LuxR C-terminal-related transcriptional regulator [Aquella oligotrophica]|uniref:HTH luxR-type domain-containing protein n=1 Tax=Aquella oligotrophica TaxID=2067065 RepID=A0A2I7N2S8_9NEIS|nr:LuxR C-terminal-related transcriptional regulator [Aquella oligotrophica]AUR50757.1 hypothetical protein CUN60_00080 [Aquella oligotrophica]